MVTGDGGGGPGGGEKWLDSESIFENGFSKVN